MSGAKLAALLQQIRRESSLTVWNAAIATHRRGSNIQWVQRGAHWGMYVANPHNPAVYYVELWPEDTDWSCECDSNAAVCVHVATAIIAVQQGLVATTDRDKPALRIGQLHYRFYRTAQGLGLRRDIVCEQAQGENQCLPLPYTLQRIEKQPQLLDVSLPISSNDLAIDKLVQPHRDHGSALPRAVLEKVLQWLIDTPNVWVDKQPVNVTEAPPTPIQRHVYVQNDQILVHSHVSTTNLEWFKNGAALQQQRLFVPQASATAIPKQMVIQREQFGEFLGQTLPAWQRSLEHHVEVVTQKLPKLMALPLGIEIFNEQQDQHITLRSQLIYGGRSVVAHITAQGALLPNGWVVPIREQALEQQAQDKLRAIGLPPHTSLSMSITDAARMIAQLMQWPIAKFWRGEVYQRLQVLPTAQLAPIDWQQDPTDLYFTVEHANAHRTLLPATAVLAAFERGETCLELPDGQGFCQLPMAFIAAQQHSIRNLLEDLATHRQGRLHPARSVQLTRLCADLQQTPPPAISDAAALLLTPIQQLPPLPRELPLAVLRSYQQDGVRFLRARLQHGIGCLLADEMGLGKTLQAICCITGKTLVVAPKSVTFAWQAELARYRPELTTALLAGNKRALDANTQVHIVSYGVLRRDIAYLAPIPFDLVILDEAHTIKNSRSQNYQCSCQLQAKARLALSGTPMENHVGELYNLFHFLNPHCLGKRSAFLAHWQQARQDPVSLRKLHHQLAPLMLRRRKTKVAKELPPRTEITLHCQLSSAERQFYQTIAAAAQPLVHKLLQAPQTNRFELLESLLRLRQACCHPALVPGSGPLAAQPSAKLVLLLERCQELLQNGHKVLVFSQWTSMLDLIEARCHTMSLPSCRLDGQTSDRKAVVEHFQTSKTPSLMLISLKAGGVGITLTAADHVFLFEPWWNPAVETQAADRAHRLGQDKPVFVYRLIARDTIEERMLHLQQEKQHQADTALADCGFGVNSLQKEDWQQLFQE